MKFLKWLGGSIIVIIVFLCVALWVVHKPLPVGHSPEKADLVAQRLMGMINKEGYDSISVISWDYLRGYSYTWYKSRDLVNIYWDDYEVLLDTKKLTGTAFRKNEQLWDEEKEEILEKAWKQFANDSFWLVAPFKIFDPGTERYLVDIGDNRTGLLVKYTSGGVTPGDSYLWVLDENYIPVAFKIWAEIIPIGGIKFEWMDWRDFNGVKMAANHIGPFGVELPIRNLEVKW